MPMSHDTTTTTSPADHDRVRGALARSGVLRSWRPDDQDGGPTTVAQVAGRLSALGSADADTGWIGAVAAVTNLAVAELPEGGVREVWQPGRQTLVCGTLAPQGTGTWVGGDFRVRAVSTPASGLPWADWVMATVRDVDTDELVRVVVPVQDVRVETTWDAAGLRGSGGDTAHLEDVVVPARRVRTLVPTPTAAPLTFFATLFFAAPLVGTVQAALRDVLAAAADGGPRWTRPDVRASVTAAARRVDRATALYAGAVAGLGGRADVDARSAADRAAVADLAVQAVTEAEAALPVLVSAAGASALHASHPLARAVRDVGVGARHTALSPTKSALAYGDALFARSA